MLYTTINYKESGYLPGEIREIKKLKNPVKLKDKKFKYIDVDNGALYTRNHLKKVFKKGAYKEDKVNKVLSVACIIIGYKIIEKLTKVTYTMFTAGAISVPEFKDKWNY